MLPVPNVRRHGERAAADAEHVVEELAPVRDAVVTADRHAGVAVLDAIHVDGPFVGVVRAMQVGAVGRWQEATGPDVEFIAEFEARDGIQHFDLVGVTAAGIAGVLGVEGELDVVGDRAADVQAHAVQIEVIGRFGGAVHFFVGEAGAHAGADADRRRAVVRQDSGRCRQRRHPEHRRNGEPRRRVAPCTWLVRCDRSGANIGASGCSHGTFGHCPVHLWLPEVTFVLRDYAREPRPAGVRGI